ncbi:unnamed protein product [Adineta steineri]|uniref:Peptidase S9 prolyl oligopeptidase catalytic domain-containing protein n=1 Tax=Adineta steineri TaxID=433720 RepID=A0A814ZUT5_9BILA|nr:unnamed protein product [Adineta steineri]
MINDCADVVNYVYGIRVACSIFSLPFKYDYLRDIGNNLPNIVFSYVTYLLVQDIMPFEHEFFMRIARSFPLLKHLYIWNSKSQKLNGLMTFSSDNCQLQPIIEYPHLTILDVNFAHIDYVEQFLNETKTFVPCLTKFRVSSVNELKAVTKEFTRKETRRNCAKRTFDLREMAYAIEELWFTEHDSGGFTQYKNSKAFEKFDPIHHIANCSQRMLVIQGERDYRVPDTQSIGAFTALQR